MALVQCPECGKEISETAKSCPNCGFLLFKNRRKNNFKEYIIKNKKLVIILVTVLLCVSIFCGLLLNEKYPLDSGTIGKQITENEIENILKNNNVIYSVNGDWQILRFIKEVTIEDIPMAKIIMIEDNRIISVGLSVNLLTSERSGFQNDTTQIIDTSAELEEKGRNIFNKLVSEATEKYGTNYEYEQEQYDELRTHEKYVWTLNNNVIYQITVLWARNENNETNYSSITCFYGKEDL